MIVDGIFYIKGRGWALTGEPGIDLILGQTVHNSGGKIIGNIYGLEYSIGNFGKRPNVGIILHNVVGDNPYNLIQSGDEVTFGSVAE